MKKEFVKLSGVLCAITLAAALLLAWVNSMTEEKIAAADEKATEEAMRHIMTAATTFTPVTDEVYEAKDKNGTAVGWCATVTEKGFGGDLVMMVGLDTEYGVCGIEILSHSETPGLGAKATEEAFKKQFVGKSAALSVVKKATDNQNEVQAITGATITSRAAAIGVADAKAMIENAREDK